jgi:predicted Abi (CAAX) family protease
LLILSTILNRLWVSLLLPPNGPDLLITWALFCGYWLATIPSGLINTLVNFEPIEVWLNLEMYRDGLRLYGNRQAVKLMAMLLVWVTIEELICRAFLVPLSFERLSLQDRANWMGIAVLVASARYVFGYRRLHSLLNQRRFFILAALLELGCFLTYVWTESLWLTVFFHWLVVVVWLLPLGGRYQLQRYNKLSALGHSKSKLYSKD